MIMVLRADQLSISFGGIHALNETSINARKGAITALIGPNGAGKTTLFNTITGFTRASSGTVVFKDEDITRLKPWQIAKRGLSRTFQTPSGFSSMSVWENLMVAGSESPQESPLRAMWRKTRLQEQQQKVSRRVAELLESLNLIELQDCPLIELSVADLRFVEIARQLMSAPDLLMLDEPAAGFGPDKIDLLERLIRHLKRNGTTVLVVEHNLSFVLRLADYVFVLANGVVISHGVPDEISKDDAVIRNYTGSSHGIS
jgi:ABC-type branched-subunit amino acid transport system ATPase component